MMPARLGVNSPRFAIGVNKILPESIRFDGLEPEDILVLPDPTLDASQAWTSWHFGFLRIHPELTSTIVS